MSNNGRYWDRPWSLVDGCTPCSPGCEHCWSMAMGKRFRRWPDKVTVRSDRLDIPLRTRKPTMFAVWNDLFHADVPEEFIDRVFGIIALCPQHTFLVLTKRAGRMAKYMNCQDGDREPITGCGTRRSITLNALDICCEVMAKNPKSTIGAGIVIGENDVIRDWPLPNIYLGLTVCNQQEADEKIPQLLQMPGKKWLSIEPMLGPISFRWMKGISRTESTGHLDILKDISCVILGGETGPGARPMHPDWVRSVRDQCQASGTPCFFKQWGEWGLFEDHPGLAEKVLYGDPRTGYWQNNHPGHYQFQHQGVSSHGQHMLRVGSKRAGRLLDGREWNELPWTGGIAK